MVEDTRAKRIKALLDAINSLKLALITASFEAGRLHFQKPGEAIAENRDWCALEEKRRALLAPIFAAYSDLNTGLQVAESDLTPERRTHLSGIASRIEGLGRYLGDEIRGLYQGKGNDSEQNFKRIAQREGEALSQKMDSIIREIDAYQSGSFGIQVGPAIVENKVCKQPSKENLTKENQSSPLPIVGTFDETTLIWTLPDGETVEVGRRMEEGKPSIFKAWFDAVQLPADKRDPYNPSANLRLLKKKGPKGPQNKAIQAWTDLTSVFKKGKFACPKGCYPRRKKEVIYFDGDPNPSKGKAMGSKPKVKKKA